MREQRTRSIRTRKKVVPKTASTRRWKVHLTCDSSLGSITPAIIRRLAQAILTHVDHEIAPAHISELHIMIVSDARMQEINFQHRKKDKPTDVLSFPQFTPAEIRGRKKVVASDGSYLGDLVLSSDTTRAQAKRFGVTLHAEVIRLLVHGLLHLCGYDHEKVPAREAQRMRRRERQLRETLAQKSRVRSSD